MSMFTEHEIRTLTEQFKIMLEGGMDYATVDTVEFNEFGTLDSIPTRKRFFIRVLEVPVYGRNFTTEDKAY